MKFSLFQNYYSILEHLYEQKFHFGWVPPLNGIFHFFGGGLFNEKSAVQKKNTHLQEKKWRG